MSYLTCIPAPSEKNQGFNETFTFVMALLPPVIQPDTDLINKYINK